MEPRNFSYIFIPLRIKQFETPLLNVRCDASESWERKQDSLRYLLRYVANKIDGTDGEARCRHYVMTKGCDIIGKKCVAFHKCEQSVTEAREGRFELTPKQVELYTFSTGICLGAVLVELGSSDPKYQINARYHLKFVDRTQYTSDLREGSFTILQLFAEYIGQVAGDIEPEYFFYTESKNRLSFVLTYMDCDDSDDTAENIAYLRNCAARSYCLYLNEKADEEQNYRITNEVSWGITDQSAVCLGHRNGGNPDFIDYVFLKNFKREYKFMFVFLLHQKYALYNFMMQIDTELRSSLSQLESYKERLGEFKTYFVFSRISETPQYQGLYEKVCRAFALESMYLDVNEPLDMMGEIIRKKEQKQREEEEERAREEELSRAGRENRLGLLLAMLSLLGIYSAFADASQFAEIITSALGRIGFSAEVCAAFVIVIRVIFFLSIVLLAAYIIANMLKAREKKNKKKK